MIQEFVIKKDNVENFINPEWQRNIRQTNVDKFRKIIKEGNLLGTLLTVNKINGKFRLINGNHRINAIRDVIDKVTNVKVVLDIYEDLTKEEEKDLFAKISIETPLTVDDLLYINKKELKLYNKLNKDLPIKISIYRHKNNVRLKTIIDCIDASKSKNKSFDIRSIGKDRVVEVGKNINELDFEGLNKFFNLFKNSVGDVQENRFYKPIILVPLLNIFLLHHFNSTLKTEERMSNEQWIKLFQKILIDTILMEYSYLATSREKMIDVRERILHLNKRVLRGSQKLI